MRTLRERFSAKGYVVLKDVWPTSTMRQWKSEIVGAFNATRHVRDPSTGNVVDTRQSGVRVWMSDSATCPRQVMDGLVTQTSENSTFMGALAELLTPDPAFLSVKAVVKMDSLKFASPWHQDHQYWGGSHKVSAWISLDHARQENGALKVIPGSHLARVDHTSQSHGEGFDFRVDPSAINPDDVVTVELAPGSVILFHDLLLHASHPNTTGQDRFALIPTYRNNAEVDESTVWKASKQLDIKI